MRPHLSNLRTSWVGLVRRYGGVPFRFVRLLFPIPLTPWELLGVGFTSFGLGELLQRAFGLRWWIGTLYVLGAFWLAFLIGGVVIELRSDGLRKSLRTLINNLDPKGIEARSARRHADLLRRCLDFPIYGLPQTSPVERSVKVWETLDSERVWRVNLRHEFSSGDYIGIFCELAQEEDGYPSTTGFSYKDLGRIMAQKLAQVDVTISVDGTGIPFQAGPRDLDNPDRGWQANGAVGSVEVQINAVGSPIQDVKLVTILDVEPYLEGTAREQERLEALRRTIRERRKSRLLDP